MNKNLIITTLLFGLSSSVVLAKQPKVEFAEIKPKSTLSISEESYEIQRLEAEINQLSAKGLIGPNGQFKTSNNTLASPPIIGIEEGKVYYDSLDVDTPEKWYIFNVANHVKLTALLQQVPQNHNYDISLFGKPTGVSEYSYIGQSSMPGSSNEQMSAVAQPGSYIMVVQAIGTASSDSYLFGTQHSIFFDANEPDDNFWQARQIDALDDRAGTIDGPLDKDYFRITLAEQTKIEYKITGGDFQAQLLYTDGSVAYTLANNSDIVLTLPPQSFYWRIYSPTGSFNDNYNFTTKEIKRVHRITFRNRSDSHGFNNKFIWNRNFSESNRFGLKDEMHVFGYAYDSSNQPIEGAKLHFRIDSSGNFSSKFVTLTTDDKGSYSGVIESPIGIAEYKEQESHGCSHYDSHVLTISDAIEDINTPLARVETMDDGNIENEDGFLPLYDIAYYAYGSCD